MKQWMATVNETIKSKRKFIIGDDDWRYSDNKSAEVYIYIYTYVKEIGYIVLILHSWICYIGTKHRFGKIDEVVNLT